MSFQDGLVEVIAAHADVGTSACFPFRSTLDDGLTRDETVRVAEITIEVVGVGGVEEGVVEAIGDGDHNLGRGSVSASGKLLSAPENTFRDRGVAVNVTSAANAGAGVRLRLVGSVAARHGINGIVGISGVGARSKVKVGPVDGVERNNGKADGASREIELLSKALEEDSLLIELCDIERARAIDNDANIERFGAHAILGLLEGGGRSELDVLKEDLTTISKFNPT